LVIFGRLPQRRASNGSVYARVLRGDESVVLGLEELGHVVEGATVGDLDGRGRQLLDHLLGGVDAALLKAIDIPGFHHQWELELEVGRGGDVGVLVGVLVGPQTQTV